MGLALFKYMGIYFKQETPTGSIDGSNTAFELSTPPVNAEGVQVYVDGLLKPLTPGSLGFTISGTTVTLGTAPVAGQHVYVCYPSTEE